MSEGSINELRVAVAKLEAKMERVEEDATETRKALRAINGTLSKIQVDLGAAKKAGRLAIGAATALGGVIAWAVGLLRS